MRLFAAVMTACLLVNSTVPGAKNTSARLFDEPFGRARKIVSPVGDVALWADYENSRLWAERLATHEDRLVGPYTVQTISLAWSPDGRHFVVNDRETSTESDAYLYNAETLQRTRLRDLLTTNFPDAIHYLVSNKPGPDRGRVSHARDVMHSYVDVRRWIDDRHVELQLHGSFAGRFRNNDPDGHLYPGGCFDLRFSMGLDGSVRKISELRNPPLTETTACGWGSD